MLIQYIQVKMQANSWLTLRWLIWGAFQVKASRRLVSRSRVVGSIGLTFDWYQHYWKCLQQSKSRKISTCLRVKRTSIRTIRKLLRQYCQVAELQFFCGYALNNIKIIWYRYCMPQPRLRLSYLWFCQHIWPEAMHSTRSFYKALLSVGYSP